MLAPAKTGLLVFTTWSAIKIWGIISLFVLHARTNEIVLSKNYVFNNLERARF